MINFLFQTKLMLQISFKTKQLILFPALLGRSSSRFRENNVLSSVIYDEGFERAHSCELARADVGFNHCLLEFLV